MADAERDFAHDTDEGSEPESPSSPSPYAESPPLHFPTGPTMTSSSTPLGNVNAARRPGPLPSMSSRGSNLTGALGDRLKAFHIGRQAMPHGAAVAPQPPSSSATGSPRLGPGGIPSNIQLPPGLNRSPQPNASNLSPRPGQQTQSSLAMKRGINLGGSLTGPVNAARGPPQPQKKRPGFSLNLNGADQNAPAAPGVAEPPKGNSSGSLLDKYKDLLDSQNGLLIFKGKAKLGPSGVEFDSGKTFSISLDEVDMLDELGKGNYGTVYRCKHARPRMRRPGLGLAGNKATTSNNAAGTDDAPASDGTSGVIMAMKEIRLELEDSKFAAIIMELDILHRCVSPFIVDFYGAFFQEGAVYICMEYMDGGSIDKLYADGVPETILQKIALSTVMGLKYLKDEQNIIHRDVKPTNILMNTNGFVKLCDFGVSGNLVASIAKTNIGCQSYMAPERISSGGMAQAGAANEGTYGVQSDIWSLGLTLIECALGRYPYPPETYDNIFSQLSAIVDGEPPDLPEDAYSEMARDFVRGCLAKIPKLRPTYAMLLQHGWLAALLKPPTIAEEDEDEAEDAEARGDKVAADEAVPQDASGVPGDPEIAKWVRQALEKKRSGLMGKKAKAPALHAAPLDQVPSPGV